MFVEDGKVNKVVKIDYSSSEWLKKIALQHLGLSNMNQLRDRFEGQEYLNNFLRRSYLEIAFEKFSQSKKIVREKKELIKGYEPLFNIGDKRVSLLHYTIDEFPRIPIADFDIGVFGLVNLDSRTVNITGFLERSTIIKLIKDDDLSLISKKYLGKFQAFDNIYEIEKLFPNSK